MNVQDACGPLWSVNPPLRLLEDKHDVPALGLFERARLFWRRRGARGHRSSAGRSGRRDRLMPKDEVWPRGDTARSMTFSSSRTLPGHG